MNEKWLTKAEKLRAMGHEVGDVLFTRPAISTEGLTVDGESLDEQFINQLLAGDSLSEVTRAREFVAEPRATPVISSYSPRDCRFPKDIAYRASPMIVATSARLCIACRASRLGDRGPAIYPRMRTADRSCLGRVAAR